MCRTWDHAAVAGTIGLVHPDTHFTGEREASLRAAAYHRLRMHGDFVNAGQRFFAEPVGHTAHFGVHIYGQLSEIAFEHLSWLVSADALRLSGTHDSNLNEIIGIRRDNAAFDDRPHRSRVVRVTPKLLAVWQRLLDETDVPVDQARLLFPVSMNEAAAIEALAEYPHRLGKMSPQISMGYLETDARDDGLIDYNRVDPATGHEYQPESWRRVVLKPPQFTTSTPVFKRYDANSNDPYGRDLVNLACNFIPDSEYVHVPGRSAQFLAARDRWLDRRALDYLRNDPRALARAQREITISTGSPLAKVEPGAVEAVLKRRATRPYTAFYRMAWRRQIVTNTERALYATLIPPGPTHVDRVNSMIVADTRQLALVAGFWSALPLDYFLRITGRADLRGAGARAMPAPQDGHPLASALLLRTLRLNCLTTAYARLWRELYEPAWLAGEGWALDWPGLPPLDDVGPDWTAATPLRTERARRSALVEIDALVAVWLGMSADALVAAYKGRFPVLQKYEAVTWFDADGAKIAGNARTIGQRQHQGELDSSSRPIRTDPGAAPPEGYTPPFRKAEREAEMTGRARGVLGPARRRANGRRRGEADAGGAGAQGEPGAVPLHHLRAVRRGSARVVAPLPRRRGAEGMFRGPYLRIRTPFRPAGDGWRGALGLASRRLHALRPPGAGLRAAELRGRPHPAADAGDHRHRVGQDRGVPLPRARPLRPRARARPARDQGRTALPDERARHRPGAAARRAAARPSPPCGRCRVGSTSATAPPPATRRCSTKPRRHADRPTRRPDHQLQDARPAAAARRRPRPVATAPTRATWCVDEFHTYDGAQGTDVAMLLRRLAAAVGTPEPGRPLGAICPVATSATLGSGTDLRRQAGAARRGRRTSSAPRSPRTR